MKKKNPSPATQQTIFSWLQQAEAATKQTATPPNGSLDIDSELRAAITADLKHAIDPDTGRELSRYEVAARMSNLLGQEVTASNLYNMTSEAHEKHRFPAQWLPAFRIATGGQRRTFEVISRHSGLFTLPGPDALRAEIHRIDEQVRELQQEKNKRETFLREINGGGK